LARVIRTAPGTIEMLRGAREIGEAFAKFAANASRGVDICSDKQSLGAMVLSGELERVLSRGREKGFRVRYLTEVTKENADRCKALGKVVELRHLEGVTGNYAISDADEYVGPLVTEEGHVERLIYSDSRPLFEQHRYLFDTLWGKAIRVEARLAELSGAAPVVQTRLMEGETEILRSIKKLMDASDELVGCTTVGVLRSMVDALPEALRGVVNRKRTELGGIRWVTSIDADDAELVEKCLRIGIQLRHSSRLPPLSFECSGNELVASIQTREEGLSMQNLLTSNEPAYVNHFRLVFEEIWRNGVDAKKTMDEVQRGLESSVVEVIENGRESINVALGLIQSAKEVLMMFSTPQAFLRQIDSELFEKSTQLLGSSQIKAKLLIPDDERVKAVIEGLKESLPYVEFRVMDKSLKAKISILVIDRAKTMIFETKDDRKEDLYEALGVTTYTESKPLAESYAIIFEGIWKQTELYEQLEIHDKMQRDFINIAAHELRTPVQAIINYAELAKDTEERKEEYYDKLLKSVFRLHKLTEDILDAARIESRTLKLNKEFFLLNEVLRSSLDEQRRAAATKHLKLYLEQPEPVYVYGDKTRVGQVLANLLINAVKFTEEGTVRVVASLDNKQGKAVIRVIDTGIGIESSLVPHLFARFMANSQSGTGLGLFISKNIIEEHGGRIWVERSEPGKGSTFAFELPVSETIPSRKRASGAPAMSTAKGPATAIAAS
jgi:two-component system sensor histidine kinase VicK